VHADDLVAILDNTPSVVVAHSAGCGIAMLSATRSPEMFLALGVWEPPMTAWGWSSPQLREQTEELGRSTDPEGTAETFNRMILGDARWEQLPEETRNRLRAEGPAFCADMASQDTRFFEIDRLRGVSTLLGCGDAYPEGIAAQARTAEEAGCEFLVIGGADHFAPITQPEAWAGFVRTTVELARSSNREWR
jgi:pimeloyl-ACP methyl ester carboxylesterase